MIKFDLKCDNDHIFEASFDDSNSFEKQRKKMLIECPFCSSGKVFKTVMAPNITTIKDLNIIQGASRNFLPRLVARSSSPISSAFALKSSMQSNEFTQTKINVPTIAAVIASLGIPPPREIINIVAALTPKPRVKPQ